ncbi:hypothetical protein MRB53_040301 [Persea americana]|nr:hypothetical protein MRB53_040301 [Persea americana]
MKDAYTRVNASSSRPPQTVATHATASTMTRDTLSHEPRSRDRQTCEFPSPTRASSPHPCTPALSANHDDTAAPPPLPRPLSFPPWYGLANTAHARKHHHHHHHHHHHPPKPSIHARHPVLQYCKCSSAPPQTPQRVANDESQPRRSGPGVRPLPCDLATCDTVCTAALRGAGQAASLRSRAPPTAAPLPHASDVYIAAFSRGDRSYADVRKEERAQRAIASLEERVCGMRAPGWAMSTRAAPPDLHLVPSRPMSRLRETEKLRELRCEQAQGWGVLERGSKC